MTPLSESDLSEFDLRNLSVNLFSCSRLLLGVWFAYLQVQNMSDHNSYSDSHYE